MDVVYNGSIEYLDCLDMKVSKRNVRKAPILFLANTDNKSIIIMSNNY